MATTVSNPEQACKDRGMQGITQLVISKTWDGAPLPASRRVRLELALHEGQLQLEIDAPFYGDPAPPGPPGPLDGLWEFEVVELFLLGRDARYLEIELSPHGHHLALALAGPRNVLERGIGLEHRADRGAERWIGSARIDRHHLPPDLSHCNAHAIHGLAGAREFQSLYPVPAGRYSEPDFHRLEYFEPLRWESPA